MRTKVARLALAATTLFSVAPAAATPGDDALGDPTILLLDDPCFAGSQFALALDALGLSALTTTTDPDTFEAALTGGTEWELVLIDSYGSSFYSSARDALIAYIEAGGLVAVAFWELDLEPTLLSALDATLGGAGYDDPLDIYFWDDSHPLFSDPVALGEPVSPLRDPCSQDGAYFEPTSQGTAIGGYTASPATNQAAIVIGNSGRSVLLGEVLHVFAPEEKLREGAPKSLGIPSPGESLARNTIHYLRDVYVFGNDFETETTCRWVTTTPAPAESCDDGLDNDCDGDIDCFDSDCFAEPHCID